MDRRSFLRWLSLVSSALGGLFTFGAASACKSCDADEDGEGAAGDPSSSASSSGAEPKLRFFDEAQALAMGAVLARLVPSDVPRGSPGATETHVLAFVDAQLMSPHFSHYEHLFKNGLRYLDAAAEREGAKFHALPAAKQDAVLRQFQTGSVPSLRFPTQQFFEVALTFAHEGFLGDPRHGGNHDKRAWKWIGIDPTCHSMFHPDEHGT